LTRSKKQFAPASEHAWVSLNQICKEINRTPVQTKKVLKVLGFIGIRKSLHTKRMHVYYDSGALEVIKALLSLPHREVGNAATDWLSQFINNGGEDRA
jgi:uncharacterized linocin/CFP29 family protein